MTGKTVSYIYANHCGNDRETPKKSKRIIIITGQEQALYLHTQNGNLTKTIVNEQKVKRMTASGTKLPDKQY